MGEMLTLGESGYAVRRGDITKFYEGPATLRNCKNEEPEPVIELSITTAKYKKVATVLTIDEVEWMAEKLGIVEPRTYGAPVNYQKFLDALRPDDFEDDEIDDLGVMESYGCDDYYAGCDCAFCNARDEEDALADLYDFDPSSLEDEEFPLDDFFADAHEECSACADYAGVSAGYLTWTDEQLLSEYIDCELLLDDCAECRLIEAELGFRGL
jgi:hypothetical protein